ncbi:YcxB family protein [Kitasatospora sp. NPDC086791]|uniref:YcxB family protein n=1 Tax=Kitasatospora sp. NPDC086791 TaxID=3155178 RepID=UPI0034392E67
MADQERVELAYAPTAEDFREAFAAQARHTTAGLLMRVLVWVPAVISGLGGVLNAVDGQAGVSDVLATAAFVALALFVPRYQLLSAQRRVARRGGEYRAVVDTAGVRVTDARGTRDLSWARLSRSLETESQFVVLSGSGNCLITLPKRGTSSPDALRALIARHTTPFTRAAGSRS